MIASNEESATSRSSKRSGVSGADPRKAGLARDPAASNQHPAKWLFAFYALFVFYAVAMPFQLDLSRWGLQYRWGRTELVPFLTVDHHWLSIGDAVANVLLFVPFGFFLHSWRLARGVPQSNVELPVAFSLLAALLFSGVIECMQLFLNGRNSSINDIMNNVVGAYFGIRLARAYPALAATKWNAFKKLTRDRPLLALWIGMMALQTLLALAPFDMTLKTESFQRQWLRWRYYWQELRSLAPSSLVPGGWLQRFPHHEHFRWTLIVTAALAIWLGALAIVCWRRYWGNSSRIFWQFLIATLWFYPFLLALQFSVQSAHPSPLFLLAGVVGVVTGMLFIGIWSRFKV